MSQADPSAKPRKHRLNFFQYLILVLVVGLVGGLSLIGGLLWLEYGQDPATMSRAEIAAHQEKVAEQAEKTATWATYHCALLHRYYAGSEYDLPKAELLGLPPDADPQATGARCQELLPVIQEMGGLPTSRVAQDNFVVCEGFEWRMVGTGPDLTIHPRQEDLADNTLAYRVGRGDTVLQRVSERAPVAIDGLAEPLVMKADDRCVVVSMRRSGRKRAIPGEIVRAQ